MTNNESGPIKLLVADHKRIRGLFRQIMVLDQRAHEMMPGLVEELFLELGIHREIQRTVIEPRLLEAFEAASNPDALGRIAEIAEQFAEISNIASELQRFSVEAELYQRKMADLRKNTELLFEKEERFVFPSLNSLLHDRLPEIISDIKGVRERILNDPRNQSARAYYVQNPNGGEHKRKLSA